MPQTLHALQLYLRDRMSNGPIRHGHMVESIALPCLIGKLALDKKENVTNEVA